MLSVPARAAFLGALFAALVTLPGLGIGTLWDNSETAYGEVAREVLLTHDWVVMHLNSHPWFVQPPLYFWIAALLAKVFGVSAFAMRLPSALATIAMGGAVGYATARIAGGRAGTVAAIVLSTSLMQAIVGRLAIMDALLDFSVAAAALWWYRAFEPTGDARRRDTAFVCGALALAVGTLAKGPVAPVVTVLIVGAWMLWERRAGKLAAPHPYALAFAALAFCAVTLPWFVALVSRVGLQGLVVLIGHYTVGRYTGVIENQTGPFWYYVPVVILGFFPWIAFLPVAAVAAWRDATKPDGAFTRFAFAWAIVPFVFFSFANTKLPNYVALILPALAILVALWFERVPPGTVRRAAVVSAATVPIFVGCVALAIAVFTRTNRLDVDTAVVGPELAFLGVAMLLGSLVTVLALARARTAQWAPYVLAVTSGALVLFIAFVAEPAAEPLKPIPPLAQAIEAQRQAGDTVGIHGVAGGNGLIFYTAPPVVDVKNNAVFRSMMCAQEGMWIVTTPEEGNRFIARAQSAGRQAEVVATAPGGDHPRAALLHVFGDPCHRDAALR
ncbi:MAG TPA: glycosyltransferase family 39 protein [Candidatus Limnocylindria bacterium]|jgi:4-amino-4-deoxy-L-arabinose transferase-like glycosyltransferase|nr:glycosyltransferase family 39 protein [Candidatus Limnocylindria bacterium]